MKFFKFEMHRLLFAASFSALLIAPYARATTTRQQLDAAWGTVPPKSVPAEILHARALMSPGPGTLLVDITTEITNMNTASVVLCKVVFTRFLQRPIEGPGDDQWYVVTPYYTGKPYETGGTASVTRTFAFTADAQGRGVFAKISCETSGREGANVRAQVKSVFVGND